MSQAHVIEVSVQNFATEVLNKSREVPVLIDFWAEWCGPCRSLTPILEKLAEAYQGRFILAKCNTDQNQELARQFGIRGIPACKLFKDGEMVAEFQGAQPEREVRRFLDQHCDNPTDQPLEVARELLGSGDAAGAVDILKKLSAQEPDLEEARFLLVRALLQSHDFATASEILATLPKADREVESLQQMINYAQSAAEYGTVEQCEARIKANPQDFEALYQLGVVLTLDDRFEEAMDRFLQVIAKNKNFGDGKVRKAMLALFEVMGAEHPLTHIYRRKFANLVLS